LIQSEDDIIDLKNEISDGLDYQIFKDKYDIEIHFILHLKSLTFFNLNPKDISN
jgi:hypothetical protein